MGVGWGWGWGELAFHPFALPTLHAFSTYTFVICWRKSEQNLRPDFCYSLISSMRQGITTITNRHCKMREINIRKNHLSYLVTAYVNMANFAYGTVMCATNFTVNWSITFERKLTIMQEVRCYMSWLTSPSKKNNNLHFMISCWYFVSFKRDEQLV